MHIVYSIAARFTFFFFFFFKEKTKNHGSGVPTPPCSHVPGLPVCPLSHLPHVSTATLPLSQKTDVQGQQAKAVAQSP